MTVGVAALGYAATYLNNLRLAVRKDTLDRINSQLKDFYGPLLALLSASHLVYNRWRETESTSHGGWEKATDQRKDQWRLWISTVFMPLNRHMVDIVITHAHLIDEDYMPPELLVLCAHVSGYEALMKQWDEGDYSRMLPYVLFPGTVLTYAQKSFQRLKSRQARLIGFGHKRTQVDLPTTLDHFKLAYPQYFRDVYSEDNV